MYGILRLQGAMINDKHIEVIVRQMLRKIEVTNPGDSSLLRGVQMDRGRLFDVIAKEKAAGKEPATWEHMLLGITKASLATESFISAASFQETKWTWAAGWRIRTSGWQRGSRRSRSNSKGPRGRQFESGAVACVLSTNVRGTIVNFITQ
ncbi:MAG: hypothetical protein U1F35_15770 [Steroidobacteraceae bacterium]